MTQKQKDRVIRYLECVIQEHGPDHHIMSYNCQGNPQRPEDYYDYYIDHGRAEDILSKIKRDEPITTFSID